VVTSWWPTSPDFFKLLFPTFSPLTVGLLNNCNILSSSSAATTAVAIAVLPSSTFLFLLFVGVTTIFDDRAWAELFLGVPAVEFDGRCLLAGRYGFTGILLGLVWELDIAIIYEREEERER
jgi:hypothetical protein